MMVILLALLFPPACSSSAPGAGAAVNLDDLPTLALEEVARIGSVDDPDYGFSRLGAIDVDESGNLYAYEGQDREIRVYSPNGELIRRIGRSGEGPGEFARVERFGVRGDTVWTYDHQLRRLTLFSSEGNVLSTAQLDDVQAPLHVPGQTLAIWPAFIDDDGLFVGGAGWVMVAFGAPERDTVDIPIVRFGMDGRVVDTIGSYPRVRQPEGTMISVGRSKYLVPSPPDFDSRVVLTATELITIHQPASADDPRVRITRVGHSGDTVRMRTFTYRPKPFPEQYLDSIATTRAHAIGPVMQFTSAGIERIERHAEDSAAARTAIRRKMSVPAWQPPVQGHYVTAHGAVWLHREQAEGSNRRWTILNEHDEPVGSFELPRGLRIMWAGEESLWAMVRDDLDVPWLVNYRIRPARAMTQSQ